MRMTVVIVKIEPYSDQDKLKTIYPGEEVSFRFRITNTGKKADTMTLSVSKPLEYQGWQTRFEIDGVDEESIFIVPANPDVFVHLKNIVAKMRPSYVNQPSMGL